MHTLRFSIIVPVYKVETFLHQCITSVLEQTFTSYELILVDDGSPDNSPAICDKYAQEYKHVRVIHKTNGGLSSARNAGLDIATGEYVLFLDSDDWWDDKNTLQKIADKIESENADIIIFGMKKFFSITGKIGDVRNPDCAGVSAVPQAERYQRYMQRGIFIACACDKAVRRQLIEQSHMRFVLGQLSEDIEWCIRLLMCSPNMSVLPECFYVYRQQTRNSITANITIRNVQHIHDIITKYATEDAPLPIKHFLANQYVLLLTVSYYISPSEGQDVIESLKRYWWLMHFNWYPYVRAVSKVSFLGFGITRRLLEFVHIIKKMIRRF